jgi:hypothetical protein
VTERYVTIVCPECAGKKWLPLFNPFTGQYDSFQCTCCCGSGVITGIHVPDVVIPELTMVPSSELNQEKV